MCAPMYSYFIKTLSTCRLTHLTKWVCHKARLRINTDRAILQHNGEPYVSHALCCGSNFFKKDLPTKISFSHSLDQIRTLIHSSTRNHGCSTARALHPHGEPLSAGSMWGQQLWLLVVVPFFLRLVVHHQWREGPACSTLLPSGLDTGKRKKNRVVSRRERPGEGYSSDKRQGSDPACNWHNIMRRNKKGN
jgi:hypothetical protein